MALNLPGFEPLFGSRKKTSEENVKPSKIRADSIIVAKDGTGDTDDIAEAIKLLPAEGGQIFIKEGSYYPKSVIWVAKAGVSIEGTGRNTKIYGSLLNDEDSIFSISGTDFCIEKCFFDMASTAGAITGIYDESNRALISNCWFQNGTGVAILMDGEKNIIQSNIITGCSNGVLIAISSNVVSSNIIYSCSSHGIDVQADDSLIIGNICFSNSGSGIFVNGAVAQNRNIISSNRCYSNASCGIDINGAAAERNLVIGNICNLNTTDQIRDTGTNTVEASNIEA